MKKLTILLLAVFLALSVGIAIAMTKGDLISKETEPLDNSRKTVRDHDISPADKDEIMIILMPAPDYNPDNAPEYRFGDGIRGSRLPSEVKKADVYRYKFGFTPKVSRTFVVYSSPNGVITAMMKGGEKKPETYDYSGLGINDQGTSMGDDDDEGPTCWRCYEIDGKLHCFEIKCPFDVTTGEDEESSIDPKILETVIPKDPGSTLPPGSTIPPDSGRGTGTTTTDPGRGTQDGSSSSSSTIIKRGGD